jgi:hypothetical protein
MEFKDISSMVQTFGLASVLLACIMFGLWKIIAWVGKEIILPIRDSVIARMLLFFDRAEVTFARMESSIEKIEGSIERIEGAAATREAGILSRLDALSKGQRPL